MVVHVLRRSDDEMIRKVRCHDRKLEGHVSVAQSRPLYGTWVLTPEVLPKPHSGSHVTTSNSGEINPAFRAPIFLFLFLVAEPRFRHVACGLSRTS